MMKISMRFPPPVLGWRDNHAVDKRAIIQTRLPLSIATAYPSTRGRVEGMQEIGSFPPLLKKEGVGGGPRAHKGFGIGTCGRPPLDPPLAKGGKLLFGGKALFLSAILTLLITLLIAFPVTAADWDIVDYNVDITVQEDGIMKVIETIDVDFTREARHGIYRIIPIAYRDRLDSRFRYRFQLDSVTDENGTPYTVMVTHEGGNVKVRIGDADKLVQQRMIYNISYTLDRGIRFFDRTDELYWIPIGTEWDANILTGRCLVHLPKSIPPDSMEIACWTGPYGSRNSAATIDAGDGQHILFELAQPLGAMEGMTIFIGMPKGTITEPEKTQRAAWFLSDNSMWFLPILFLIGMIALWSRRGRDPETGRSVATVYDPPDNLSPAEIGALIDERINTRDITATIIDLAVRGYIRIEIITDKILFFTKTDYRLVKVRELDDGLTLFEHELMKALFGKASECLISDLRNKFYTHLPTLKNKLYAQLKQKGYLDTRFDKVRSGYAAMGIILIVVSVMVAGATRSFMWGTAIGLCGVIVLAFSPAMPRKTLKGARAFQAIRGFEDYLATAEKSSIEFQERQNLFDKYLPYAMVLNVADQWARAFDGIMDKPPDWFSGPSGSTFSPSFFTDNQASVFSPSSFANIMDKASHDMGSGLTSSPSSSGSSSGGGGGGFSGGGGGGGGGGAW